MAFVAQSTGNPLGQRSNALRGLGDGIVHYDIGGRVRTLTGRTMAGLGLTLNDSTPQIITLNYPGTPPIVEPLNLPDPIFTATGSLMPPLQQVPIPGGTFSLSNWIKGESVVPKVPNWALVGLGGLAILAFASGGGGRKRRR